MIKQTKNRKQAKNEIQSIKIIELKLEENKCIHQSKNDAFSIENYGSQL